MPKNNINNNLNDDLNDNLLLTALKENWNQARHQETQRFWFFNFYQLILIFIISTIIKNFTNCDILLKLFPVLIILSVIMYLVFLKMSFEFKNHIKAIQWISEKLKLNIKLEDKEDRYKGYMALPLELPISLHQLVFILIPILVTSIASFFYIYFLMFKFEMFNNLDYTKIFILFTYIKIKKIFSFIFAIIIFVSLIIIYLLIEKQSDIILKTRKPKNLKIK